MSRERAWGVAGCAIVKYRRRERHGDRVSLVYLRGYRFDDAARASAGLRKLRADYVARATVAPVVSKRSVPAPALGDETAPGMRLAFGGDGVGQDSALTYWWRRDEVVAVLAVANVPHDLDEVTVLALARKIDERAAS
jgi:hypothetical protein